MTGLAAQTTGYVYQRGPAGNLTSATELSGRTVNWSYDGIYRLTNETISLAPSKNNGSVSYGLDPVGNRQSENSSLSGLPSGSWSFNADDELSSETYDADGNVTAAGGKTFSYDSQNHLVAMNGGAVQMLYDGDGNRVAKSANGVVTRYLVFSSELITAHEGAMSEVILFISITLLRASARVGTSSRPCDSAGPSFNA